MQELKKVKVLLNHVLTTADRFDVAQIKNGLINTEMEEGVIKPIQRIVGLGPNCIEGLNIGDYVLINPTNYTRPVHSLRENSVLERDKDEVQMYTSWPIITIDGEEKLFLYDRDIDMIVLEFSDDEASDDKKDNSPQYDKPKYN